MSTCKECDFYVPIDKNRGNCFGHVVPAGMDVMNCPTKSFQRLPEAKVRFAGK